MTAEQAALIRCLSALQDGPRTGARILRDAQATRHQYPAIFQTLIRDRLIEVEDGSRVEVTYRITPRGVEVLNRLLDLEDQEGAA